MFCIIFPDVLLFVFPLSQEELTTPFLFKSYYELEEEKQQSEFIGKFLFVKRRRCYARPILVPLGTLDISWQKYCHESSNDCNKLCIRLGTSVFLPIMYI